MFEKGELVCYGAHGVCRIGEPEVQRVGGKPIRYYVLIPLDQPCTKFYVPQSGNIAITRVRKLLKPEELSVVFDAECICDDVWIPDDASRKQHYKALLAGNVPTALVNMLHVLYARRRIQLNSGRKFHMCDELFLRDAEKILSSEVSAVFSVALEEALEYIRNKLDIER